MIRLSLLLALAVSACAPPGTLAVRTETTLATASPTATASTTTEPSAESDDYTEVERAVLATVSAPGIHVVRLWAPWCGNSRAEMEAGLYESIEAHPDVTFSFVTIWNDARDGAETLARYGITPSDDGQVTVSAQPDRGPSADRDLRRLTFLGVPLSWTPTTLIYNREGKLAYAFAYGEVSREMLATAIEHARDDWHHD